MHDDNAFLKVEVSVAYRFAAMVPPVYGSDRTTRCGSTEVWKKERLALAVRQKGTAIVYSTICMRLKLKVRKVWFQAVALACDGGERVVSNELWFAVNNVFTTVG